MSSTQKSSISSAKRLLATAASAAMIFALLPAGVALGASPDNVCPPPDGVETFPDVTDGVHADNVECLAGYDIAGGYADGTYRPGVDISRAQMATFIANFIEAALGVTLDEGDDAFTDDEGNVHESNINKLANIDVVSGRTAVTYGPSLKVNRAAMATFIANALDYLDDQDAQNNTFPPASTTDHFTDDEASTHEANINRLADLGIVEGQDSATEYNPGNNVFRGQMASFVMQAASAAEDAGLWAANDDTPAAPAGLNVTPTDAAVNNASTSATDNSGARTYTVSGLDDSKAYDIALLEQDDVQETADPITFDDTNSNNEADMTATNANIETVNGAAVGNVDKVTDVSPVNGQISFTVDSTGFAQVIPVVWVDSVGADDDQLDLVVPATSNANPKEAAEVFGLGGHKTWVPAEAANGSTLTNATVQFVNTTDDYFVAGGARYNYECDDVFRYDTNNDGTANQAITCTQWETALSVGDVVDTLAAYSRTFQNQFGLDNDSPGTPTDLTAASIGDLDNQNDNHDVQFTWNAPNPPNALIDTYTVRVYDDNPATTACDTGTLVRTEGSNASPLTVNDLANDTYCATVTAQSQSQTAGSASSAVFFTVQKGDADTTAPLINNLYLQADNGTPAVIDTNDVIHFDFSEAMAATTDDAGSVFRFTDPSGEIFQVTCGTNATCALGNYTPSGSTTAITNGRLTVTLTGGPTKVGGATPSSGAGTAEVPGEVTQVSSHWDDTSGNQLNLTDSPDKTIDNEL